MAQLSDLQVFNGYMYSATTQVLQQQIEMFNASTRGCITLQSSAHQGDYDQKAFFKKISGLVKRRDAHESAGLSGTAKIEHLVETSVKVAAGTPKVVIPPSQFTWIQRNPAEAGAAMGQQMAIDMFADMLNTSLLVSVTAIGGTAGLTVDKSAASPTTLEMQYLLDGTALW